MRGWRWLPREENLPPTTDEIAEITDRVWACGLHEHIDHILRSVPVPDTPPWSPDDIPRVSRPVPPRYAPDEPILPPPSREIPEHYIEVVRPDARHWVTCPHCGLPMSIRVGAGARVFCVHQDRERLTMFRDGRLVPVDVPRGTVT